MNESNIDDLIKNESTNLTDKKKYEKQLDIQMNLPNLFS